MTVVRIISSIRYSQLRFALFLAIIFTLITLVGYFFFSYYQSIAIIGRGRIYNFVTLESFSMNRINRLIYSLSEEERISGYYSILDTGQYNRMALIERYNAETSISVRKAIIFVLFYMEKGNAPEVLNELVNSDDEILKKYSDNLINRDKPKMFNSSIRF